MMGKENNNLQDPHSDGHSRAGCSSAFCCIHRLPLILISLFVVLMVIIGIAWLDINPEVPGFQLTTLSVTDFTVSDSKLTGGYLTELTVINPNKKVRVLLDHFDVRVCYRQVELSEPTESRSPTAPAPASYQLEKMGHLNLRFRSESMDPPPKMWRRKISGDLSENLKKGVVNFNVKVQVRIRFEDGNWPAKEEYLVVDCDNVDLFFSDKVKGTGKLQDTRKDCLVSIQS